MPLGKVIRKSLKLNDDREGRSQAKLVKLSIENELANDPIGLTLKLAKPHLTLIELWQGFMDDEGRNKKPSTLNFYERARKKSLEYAGNVDVKYIDRKTMFDLRDKMRNAEGLQNAAIYLRHLRAVLGWAVDNDIIMKNPLKRVDFEPEPKPVLLFKEHELERVFDACNPKLLDQCRFLLRTGFRLQESCDLRWEMIDQEAHIVKHYNQKGGRWAAYPISEELAEFFIALPRTYEPFVFGYRNRMAIDHEFLKVLRKVGLVAPRGVLIGKAGYSIHTLKKNYVSSLLHKQDISQLEVQYLSHHKSIATTLKYYSEFDIDEIRKKMNRIDALKRQGESERAKSENGGKFEAFEFRVEPCHRFGTNWTLEVRR